MKKIIILATLFCTLGVWSLTEAAPPPTDYTVYQIQRAAPNGIAIGDSVRVRHVVVTGIDVYAGSGGTFGFWVQEQPNSDPLYPYYSGILCYTGSQFPTGVARGDIMTVVGKYAEYNGTDTSTCLSEVNSYYTWAWTKEGSTAVPAPTLLQAPAVGILSSDAPRAEKWEGVLVQLDTVVCTSYDPSYPNSSWWVKEAHRVGVNPPDSVYIRTNKLPDPYPGRPDIGDTLLTLTGLHHWEASRYQICPRDGDDISYKKALPPNLINAFSTSRTGIIAVFDSKLDPVSSQNTNNYSLGSLPPPTITLAVIDPVDSMFVTLTTSSQADSIVETLSACNIACKYGTVMPACQDEVFRSGLTPISAVQATKSALNDSSQLAGQQVTVAGIVTGDRGTYATQFYLENTPGGPWSGVQVYGGSPVNPVEGDSIILSGFVAEYYNKTEISSIDYVNIVSSGNPLPGPNLVDPNQISTGSPTAESYEGVFVRCDPVYVADTTGWGFGEWDVADIDAHTVKVGHSGNYNFFPHVGRWMNIRGPMDFVFGNFRIEPRRNADIDTINVIGVEPGTLPKPQVFALEQNSPNPFNPVTNIFFSIPQRADVELYVCDVSGRVVKTLVDGLSMSPGRHKATWDGRDNAGRAVSSGVYFCKLLAADKVAQMKMVVLK